MSFLDDEEARVERDRQDKLDARRADKQLRKDVQEVLSTTGGRRLLWAFLQSAGVDYSPLRQDAASMAHAVGWQDAARWWLDAVRRHCPEKEEQMRAEARRQGSQSAQEGDND